MTVDRPELVVLDLAGTTVQDRGEVPAAFAAALAGQGLAVGPEQLRAVRGSSKREAIRTLLPPGPDLAERAAAAYAAFRSDLAWRYGNGGVQAMPGAAAAIAALRAAGIRVALNTGFDRDITGLVLDALGWRSGTADAVVCGDDVPQGRPAPYLIFRAMEATGTVRVRAVANVGDTTLDLRAGDHAGVGWNLGVCSGAHDRATLEAAPHTRLLDSVADLPGLWGL